jgi:hypothetical protein
MLTVICQVEVDVQRQCVDYPLIPGARVHSQDADLGQAAA